MTTAHNLGTDEATYLQVIRGKTAALFAAACETGGVIAGAAETTLQRLDAAFPLGKFIAVTGVSGSGKSSLVNQILAKQLAHDLNGARERAGAHEGVEGIEHLDKA